MHRGRFEENVWSSVVAASNGRPGRNLAKVGMVEEQVVRPSGPWHALSGIIDGLLVWDPRGLGLRATLKFEPASCACVQS